MNDATYYVLPKSMLSVSNNINTYQRVKSAIGVHSRLLNNKETFPNQSNYQKTQKGKKTPLKTITIEKNKTKSTNERTARLDVMTLSV